MVKNKSQYHKPKTILLELDLDIMLERILLYVFSFSPQNENGYV